jgi:hypothetical protein
VAFTASLLPASSFLRHALQELPPQAETALALLDLRSDQRAPASELLQVQSH